MAIRTLLAANAPLLGKLADGAESIKDAAEKGTPYPYLVIGEASGANDDTKDTDGVSFSVTIHCWSRYHGRKEVKEILGHVYDALHHVEIPMNGYRCVDCRFETSDSFLDPDGKTRHGVITFDIDVEPA